jgi:hypothetical protein
VAPPAAPEPPPTNEPVNEREFDGLEKARKKAETGFEPHQDSAMETSLARLDLTQVFCDVDDFCQCFERHWQAQPQLPSMPGERRGRSRMSLSDPHIQSVLHLVCGAALAQSIS